MARVSSILGSPPHLFALAAVICVVAIFSSVSRENPPGFYRDEASLSLNAARIAAGGRDEYGGRFPLFFKSFGDYKSPAWVYTVAGVFVVTGPSKMAARATSAFFGLAAVLVVGLIGWRLSGRREVGIVTGVLTGLVPWLFEVTRLAFEVASTPLAFALVLLCALEGSRRARWPLWLSVGMGLSLAFLTYSYQTGRLYGPLLAVAVALLVSRARLPGIAITWAVFFVTTVLPIAVFNHRHAGAFSSRFGTTTFISDEMPRSEIVRMLLDNYWRVFDLRRWTFGGDVNPRHHVQGVGTLLLAVSLLAIAGLVIVIREHRRERFWWFFLAALFVVPIPASLVWGQYHALRSAVLPICLCVLSVPAIDLLLRKARSTRSAMVVGVALTVLAVGQAGWFQVTYWRHGQARGDWFENGVSEAVRTAFLSSTDGRVFVPLEEPRGRTQLEWWALLLGRGGDVVGTSEGGVVAPPGAVVFVGGDVPCEGCEPIIQRAGYSVYRTPG